MNSRTRLAVPDDYEGLLNRKQAARAVRVRMQSAHDLLYQELLFGLGLFERVARCADDTRIRDSSLRLLWHFLESLDATDVLVSAGAVKPAVAQARVALDVGMQLLYLLDRNDERVGAAYTTHHRRQHLASARRFVRGSQQRKEVEAEARRTKVAGPGFIDRIPDTAEEVRRLEKSLQDSLWHAASEELERLGDPKRWYAAFGGPKTFKELARWVGMELWASYIYTPWSRHLHMGAPERVFIPREEGEMSVRALRDSEGWKDVVGITHPLVMEVYRAIIDRFRDGEQKAFARWYLEEVRPRLQGSELYLSDQELERE